MTSVAVVVSRAEDGPDSPEEEEGDGVEGGEDGGRFEARMIIH